MALLLCGVSVIPRYYLVAAGVRNVSRKIGADVCEVLSEPHETREIHAVRRSLERIMQMRRSLRQSILVLREELAHELAVQRFGATLPPRRGEGVKDQHLLPEEEG